MKWTGTNEDLLNLFTGRVDQDVIEAVIFYRNNDLSMAFKDLNEIAMTSDPQPNCQHLSSNEEKIQIVAATCSSDVDWERLSKNETPVNRVIYLVLKGYKVMVIMRGCPGSGKSYQATNILNQCYKNANVDNFIFSTDKFFIDKHSGKYHFNLSKINDAHKWTYSQIYEAVEHEVTPIIIDNTHVQAWEMEKYFKLAVNYGYWIEIFEPTSEWAWDKIELFKKNVHGVPMNTIILMLNRYEHNINVDSLLTKFKLKYNKNNQPPKLSNHSKNYQYRENLIGNKNLINEDQTKINVNVQFKDLHISQKLDNDKKIKQYTNFNDGDDHPWVGNNIHKKELSIIHVLNNDVSDIDEESQSTSSVEEASNYVHKSINTFENEFQFMEILNELPEEEYSNYVFFGKNRNINEGNESVITIPCGRLDKSTMTCDLKDVAYKLNLNELHKQFPENLCLLITELFDKCEGNIDWIIEMLVESGYDVSKHQLHNLFQSDENKFIDNIKVEDAVENVRQNNLFLFPSNSQPKTVTSIENKTEETKKKKVVRSKKKQLLTMDTDLRKNIENKFTFGDSLYSEQLLKIKKFKENKNVLNYDNIVLPSTTENFKDDMISINNDEVKFVQIAIDTSVLAQLSDYFGDFSSDLSKVSLQMPVKLPEKLAEDLYYCLIANVPTDIFDQEAILQDESFARKLQEDYKEECSFGYQNSCTGELSFAAVLSKKLLLEKFKNLDPKLVMNVLHANEYKLQKASDVLSEISGIEYLTTLDNPDIIENKENCVGEKHKLSINQNYRQEALEHAHMKQHYLNKANKSLSTKIHPSVTGYYLDKAEESKQNEKYTNTKALIDMIKNNENAITLDLHYFPVQDAILILDLYLDNHISKLKQFNSRYSRGKQLTIITGRGKHSPKGIARIKPVVLQRLQFRRLMYLEPETPGLIMVIIKRTSFLSSEL